MGVLPPVLCPLRSTNIIEQNGSGNSIVVVCTGLRGKELHREVGMGIVVTSGSLCGEMVAHWPRMQEMLEQFLL